MPINYDFDEDNHNTLQLQQDKSLKDSDTQRTSHYICRVYNSQSKRGLQTRDPWLYNRLNQFKTQ